MTSASKLKGDRAEREVERLLRDELGVPARRALGAGRKDDMGDISGIPNTVVSVAAWADLDRAVNKKLPELAQQQERAGADYAAMFCRRRGRLLCCRDDTGDVVLDDARNAVTDCPCGCGRSFSPIGSRGRARSYFSPACSLRVNRVSGGGEGRRHSAETKALLSERAKRPKPWLRGEANGMSGRVGPLNPNWRGGSSPERQRLYSGAAWRKLRREVRRRDGLRCRNCHAQSSLHMHHVKPWATHPDLRFDPTNVVLLCRTCHYDHHRKEVRYQ